MKKIVVRSAAQDDIDDSAEFIAANNPSAAEAFLDAVETACHKLLEFPRLGRCRDDLTVPDVQELRSWPVSGFANWLIFYLPTSTGIVVVRVLHGARDLGTILEDER